MRKHLLYVLLVWALICPALAYGQGGVPASPIQFTGPTGRPLAGATVTVCTSAGTGFPCSPLASIFTNSALTIASVNPVTTDGNGNLPVIFAAPGVYILSVTGSGITSTLVTATVAGTGGGNVLLAGNNAFTGNNTHSGSETFTGTLTFSNHNAMFWAGPGATPTIDQAVASCGANPCWVEISPLYTGVESANLITLSTGHKVYSGLLNVTISDRRGNTSGSQPNYPILYGGRLAGQLVRMGVNGWSSSPADSTGAATSINWVQGVMPSTGGTQNGSVSVILSHDSVTEGTANVPYVGQDGECDVTATTFDIPHNFCYGINGQTNIVRANGAQSVTNAVGLHAAVNSNVSSAGAVFVNNYGAYLEAQSGGTSRNYSLYTLGNNLMANESQLHALDIGTAFTITAATESAQTVTITTSVVCSLVANQQVAIAGVGIAGYNGTFFVVSPCGGGSTFTYVNPFAASLGASSGGTATGSTPRTMAYYRNTNRIDYSPLSDAQGWNWLTQAGALAFRVIPGSIITSNIPHVFANNLNFTNMLFSPTAPTIAAAGCGGAAASIVISNGTGAFKVNVGTTPTTACTITMPAATTGWNCFATDITTNSTSVFLQKQTGAESTTSVVITNFSDVAVATAFTASDILKVSCHAD